MAACSSCRAGIVWASMRGTGAPMPCDVPAVDVHEVEASTVAVRARDRLGVVLTGEQAIKVRAAPGTWAEWTFHRSHWDSCASSAEHRVNPDQERMEL